jgi:hypothetical protein
MFMLLSEAMANWQLPATASLGILFPQRYLKQQNRTITNILPGIKLLLSPTSEELYEKG